MAIPLIQSNIVVDTYSKIPRIAMVSDCKSIKIDRFMPSLGHLRAKKQALINPISAFALKIRRLYWYFCSQETKLILLSLAKRKHNSTEWME